MSNKLIEVDRQLSTVDRRDMTQSLAAMSESASMLAMIERAARDPSVDVDKFERLMKMAKEIKTDAAKAEFNAAVSEAKGEIGPVFKNKKVDFTSAKGRTNYSYEDFAQVARTVDPVFEKYGLSYRYRSAQEGKKLRVTCILSHRAGYSEETSLEASDDESGNKNSIQAIGSTVTYLQRYTLRLAIGLSSSQDDDGRASSASTAEPEKVNEAEVEELRSHIIEVDADLPTFLRYIKIERLEDLPKAHVLRAHDFLNTIAAMRKKDE